MRISRADDSVVGRWWHSFDRVLLGAMVALMAAGLVLSLAASPAVAMRKGLPALFFAERQIGFAVAGLCLMIAVSMLSPFQIRRLALLLLAGGLAAMAIVLFWGEEINGARRWLRIAGFSLQPSELMKPGFAVISAWAFAESERRPDMPAIVIAVGLLAVTCWLLVLQPDIGQTLLVCGVWMALFVLSGRSHLASLGLGAAAAAGLAAAYATFPHVKYRIDRFITPVRGDNSQIDRAHQSFAEGGLLGRGPGEGTIKTVLPDAHTDFVFAVVAEEFGALVALVLLGLIATVAVRPLVKAAGMRDGFIRYGTISLALMVGFQSLINLGSNVGLLPAKGMTLPFLSVGGSSMIAMSIMGGMLIGLTRRRADAREVRLPGLDGMGAADAVSQRGLGTK
jgi:cell division protein FtsW